MKQTIKLSGVISGSVVDGPGFRFVVFVQGCSHHCKGCHNPQTWDPDAGYNCSIQKLGDYIISCEWCHAITFSGGEPMEQAEELYDLIQYIKSHTDKEYHIMTYTGYTYENLLKRGDTNQLNLFLASDLVVDGPFIESEKSLSLQFRGSRNQRILEPRKLDMFVIPDAKLSSIDK